jgi:hypothetical protein
MQYRRDFVEKSTRQITEAAKVFEQFPEELQD